jgi:hypothetical protein
MRIDFVGFYWGGPGSPSPPFKVGTPVRLFFFDDIGVTSVEVVDPIAGLVDRDVLDVLVGGAPPFQTWPHVFLQVVGDPEGLLEGEQVVSGGEGGSDLGDIHQVADGGGLGVAVVVVVVGGAWNQVGRVVDPGVFRGVGMATGASADSGGVGDESGPSILVGASGADGVVQEGVLGLVPVAEASMAGGGDGCDGGPVAAVARVAVWVDVEGAVLSRSRGGELPHPGVLEVGAGDPCVAGAGVGTRWEGEVLWGGGAVVRARGPGVVGVGVVEEPLEVVEVGDAKGEGAGGVGRGGEWETGGLGEVEDGGHGWAAGGGCCGGGW